MKQTLHEELTELINRRSLENRSNTPDYILADYMMACLRAFEAAIYYRDAHKGLPARATDSREGNDVPR